MFLWRILFTFYFPRRKSWIRGLSPPEIPGTMAGNIDYKFSSRFVISKVRFSFSLKKCRYRTSARPLPQEHQNQITKISAFKAARAGTKQSLPQQPENTACSCAVEHSPSGVNSWMAGNGINASCSNAWRSLRFLKSQVVQQGTQLPICMHKWHFAVLKG